MGFFDDIGKSPRQQGEEDGTRGEKDYIKYTLDGDYRKGYDHGEGLHGGQESAKSVLSQVLDPGGALEKLGKSEEFGLGFDQGAAGYYGRKYQPPEKKEQPTENTSHYSGGYSSYSIGGSYGSTTAESKGISVRGALFLIALAFGQSFLAFSLDGPLPFLLLYLCSGPIVFFYAAYRNIFLGILVFFATVAGTLLGLR